MFHRIHFENYLISSDPIVFCITRGYVKYRFRSTSTIALIISSGAITRIKYIKRKAMHARISTRTDVSAPDNRCAQNYEFSRDKYSRLLSLGRNRNPFIGSLNC